MNSKSINKTNSIFSKLYFGWVQTMAVFIVMGMVLSCGSDNATTPDTNPDTNPDTTPEFFTISYPSIASESSNVSVPVIVNGKNCKLRTLTDEGSATYIVKLIPNAGLSLRRLVIDSTTGVVKNRYGAGGVLESDPGSYRVTVEVAEKPDCNTNVIVYHTITPADKNALTSYLFGGDNGDGIDEGDFNYIDTSEVTDFSSLFGNKGAFNGDISGWDTSKVKNMRNMFYIANKFNQPIGGWDTSQVTNMDGMFVSAGRFNRPLSNWNTSKVQNMDSMFLGASVFDQDLSGWTVTNVTIHDNVFFNSAMATLTDKHPKWNP